MAAAMRPFLYVLPKIMRIGEADKEKGRGFCRGLFYLVGEART
jgi:hypothetical protein